MVKAYVVAGFVLTSVFIGYVGVMVTAAHVLARMLR